MKTKDYNFLSGTEHATGSIPRLIKKFNKAGEIAEVGLEGTRYIGPDPETHPERLKISKLRPDSEWEFYIEGYDEGLDLWISFDFPRIFHPSGK